MKNLLVSLSGFGAFILGVVLSFDATGVVGKRLLREGQVPRSGFVPSSPETDRHNIGEDWNRIGDDFRISLRHANEQP